MGSDVPRARLSIRSRNTQARPAVAKCQVTTPRPARSRKATRENGPNPRSRTWNRGSRRHRGPAGHGSEGEFYIGLQQPLLKNPLKNQTRGRAAQVLAIGEPHSGRQIQATDARREGGDGTTPAPRPLDFTGYFRLSVNTCNRTHYRLTARTTFACDGWLPIWTSTGKFPSSMPSGTWTLT